MTSQAEEDAEVTVALMTAPDAEAGARIARVLVEERLAACVNLVPGVRSIYRWQGAVEDDAEILMLAKTRADRLRDLCARVRELHPYDLPEVLALPVLGGLAGYLDWVRTESAP